MLDGDQYENIDFQILKSSAGGTIGQVVGGVYVSQSSAQVENYSHLRLNFFLLCNLFVKMNIHKKS